MLLALVIATLLRGWQLGQVPAGLYRDEAFNGLDAAALLAGENTNENPFYFEANNGREPAYIYLTTIAVAILGQTALAVRITAAIVGTLTTILVYLLAKSWFNYRVGLLSAFIWAITVWPIHLSRIGLRPILMPFMMALLFWLGTQAYRKSTPKLWLLTGLLYGLAFYTYLAMRFTPILLLLILLFLIVSGRRKRLLPGLAWFVTGTLITSLPLFFLALQLPESIFGRAGQVSILNPEISGGATPFEVILRQSWHALRLFFIKGDTILRHNPPGRPIFDLFMIGPFLVGLWHCLRCWKQPVPMTLLLWSLVMLGPTILAEDAPHFLRAVGLLPAIIIFPALGIVQLWDRLKFSTAIKAVLTIGLLAGTLLLTINDYFLEYGRQPETGYWFEAAARNLAENINAYEVSRNQIFIDQRFWDGWPSIRYLLDPEQQVTFYRPENIQINQFLPPTTVYSWPYEGQEQVANGFGPGLLSVASGELAQGDLETTPYPFYSRYTIEAAPDWSVLANFDNSIQLRQASVIESDHQQHLKIDLYWSTTNPVDPPLIAFVHLLNLENDPPDIIVQSDSVPGQGLWPTQWWRPGLIVQDQHVLDLAEGFDPNQNQIIIGFYHADTKVRLAVTTAEGVPVGDTWLLQP